MVDSAQAAEEAADAAGGFVAAMRRLYGASAVVLVPLMMLVVTADTILRYFAAMPLVWAHDLTGLLLLLVYVSALPYSWPGGFHVRMDMLYDKFPRSIRRGVDAIAALAALGMGAILAYQGVLQAIRGFNGGDTTPATKILLWPFASAIALMAGLFCVSLLIHITKSLKR